MQQGSWIIPESTFAGTGISQGTMSWSARSGAPLAASQRWANIHLAWQEQQARLPLQYHSKSETYQFDWMVSSFMAADIIDLV